MFTSDRERRLWLIVLAILVAIYASMGPAVAIADALRERNLLHLAFVLGTSVMALALGVWWMQTRPGRREIGVVLLAALAYTMTILRIDHPEERTHLIEYGFLAAVMHRAMAERRRYRAGPSPALTALVATIFLGWLDEGIQSLLPWRVYDYRDVGFNALAALFAVGVGVGVQWARRRAA